MEVGTGPDTQQEHTVADRIDQRLAQPVGLRAHARFADGVSDAETLQRRGGIGQNGVDANAQVVGIFLRAAAQIDRDHAEFGALGRDGADQPDVAAIDCHGLAAGCKARQQACEELGVVIRGGTVYDGSGAAPTTADIAVKGDRREKA